MNPSELDPEWFRQLAACTSHPVGIAAPSNRRLLYANDALRELIGIQPDTPLDAWTLDNFLPSHEAARLREEVLPQVLADGSWDGDFIVSGGGGQAHQTLRNIFALRDAQGGTVAIACVFTDVSAQKAHEVELTRANQLQGAVFEFTDLLVAYLDPEMNFLMVNRAYAQADGREPEDFPGHNHFEFYPDADNEAIFREVARTAQPYHALARPFEYAHTPERGVSYWDWSLIPTRDAQGQVTGLVLTLLDVTARIQAIESLHTNQAAIDASGTAMAITDIDGQLTYVNQAFADLWQFPNPKAALGLNAAEFWEDPDAAHAVIEALHVRGAWRGELVSRQAGGGSRLLEVTAHRVCDTRGQPAHLMASFTDITERREAENLLQQERDFATRLIDNTPMIIMTLDHNGCIEHINRYFEDLGGYPLKEVRGRPWFDIYLAPEEREPTRQALRDAFAGHITRGQLLPIITRSGERREIEWHDQVLSGGDGRATSLLGIGQDVTDRQRMHSALRDRDARLERFKTTLDLTLDCVFMFDAEEMRIFYANQGACDHVGYSAEALHGMHPYDLKPEYSEKHFRQLITPLQEGQRNSLTFETIHQRSDGYTIPVEVFLQRVAPDGEPARFVAIVRDIRERVAAREALRQNEKELQRLNQSLEVEVAARTAELDRENRRNEAILNNTPEGFFALDTDGALNSVNPAFCQMLGYTEAELLEMSLVDVEANETPDEIALHMDRVMARGHDRFDTRHRRRDGSVIDVEISVTRVYLDDQTTFYAFARDITWRKQLEAALIQSRDLAEQASSAKSEFLSRMSHELRTPLNAILGFSQLLEQDPREPPSPNQRDEIEEIRFAGQHLLDLVNDVLDLARIESGRLDVQLEPVEIEPLVHTCLVQLKTLMVDRELAAQVDLNGGGSVHADPRRLRQILTNLLGNAIKYNRHGGTIRVDCASGPCGGLVIRIHDTGPGIADEDIPRVFRPFERLEASTHTTEGTGIGLALTRHLVEAMDGRIGVESVVGKGSSFWFELPLADAPPDSNDKEAPEPPYVPSLTNAQQTVLYVEDNPANLRLVERIIHKRPGLQLLKATDGETGVEIARQHRPDVILMDLNLPGISGIEALRELNADAATHEIPVIAVSANAMPRDLELGRSAGFSDYVTKPIQIGAFLELLERYLSEPKSEP